MQFSPTVVTVIICHYRSSAYNFRLTKSRLHNGSNILGHDFIEIVTSFSMQHLHYHFYRTLICCLTKTNDREFILKSSEIGEVKIDHHETIAKMWKAIIILTLLK